MFKETIFSKIKIVLTLLIITGLAAACTNSTSSDDDHDHADGFRLKMNGQTIVEQLPGTTTITGEFELTPGQETDLITIYFLSDDGDEFQYEEDSYSLGYEFDPTGIAEFEQHAEDGKWSFHIHAETEGITDLRLMLMHGGHSDFTTQNIHVQIEAE